MLPGAFVIFILIAGYLPAFAQQTQCDPAAFREAVASASASITQLHQQKSKVFREKLQSEDSDEVGHLFQSVSGQRFRFHSGHRSDLIPATLGGVPAGQRG